jgi:hypothetical protein
LGRLGILSETTEMYLGGVTPISSSRLPLCRGPDFLHACREQRIRVGLELGLAVIKTYRGLGDLPLRAR